MNSRYALKQFLTLHRQEILGKWQHFWKLTQEARPYSAFPDPPFEALLDQLPFESQQSGATIDSIRRWYSLSPIFCSGAALCQLHLATSGVLIEQQSESRQAILAALEESLESLMLETGSKRWFENLMLDQAKQYAIQSERLAVIGQLAAGVAHEIGNPLTAISSHIQILRKTVTDPGVSGQLAEVMRGIERIARIVRELVDFSRPSPFAPAPSNANEILQRSIQLLHYDRRLKSIQFANDLSETLPLVRVVPDQLFQVCINLLINAVDAMDGEGVITTRTWNDKNKVYISIADNGRGIEPEMLPRIFDPFFTTKPVGKGTGLGLSVSYGILSRYEGSIDVSSEPGKGSVFTVSLPHEGGDSANNTQT